MVINNEYEIGDFVFIRTDGDQAKRIITSLRIYKGGEVVYVVSCGPNQSEHYSFELSSEEDITVKQ